jgi:hypothetical protein
LTIRRRQRDASEKSARDNTDEFSLFERWKLEKKTTDEGSVTNSLTMLTAIPEVDLAWSASSPPFDGRSFIHLCRRSSRLRNIEETEKAKRQAAEERKKVNPDEEHLITTRCTSLFPPFFFGDRMPRSVARFIVRT